MEARLKLAGWKAVVAVVAVVVVVAVAAIQFFNRQHTLGTEAVHCIKSALVSEYTGRRLPELQRTVQDGGVSAARIEQIVEVGVLPVILSDASPPAALVEHPHHAQDDERRPAERP